MSETPNELLTTFVEQAREALASMVGLELAFDTLSRPETSHEPREIYSAINLEGDLPGCVLLALDRPLAITIVSEMLMAEPHEIEDDLLDGVGETLNMIVGNTKTVIQRGGSNMIVKPPDSQNGAPPKAMDKANAPGVVLACTVSGHPLELWIWLPGIDAGVAAADPPTRLEPLPTAPDEDTSHKDDEEREAPIARIIVLGRTIQRSLYSSRFEVLPHTFEFVDHWHDVLRSAMREPPLAVLIEERLLDEHGNLQFLFELATTWPVLRFSLGSTGAGELINGDGTKRAELSASLAQITARDESWLPANGSRSELRVSLVSRVQFRPSGVEDWHHANALDMSSRGIFILSYDPPPRGTEIELRVMDLGDEELALRGTVVWTRNWQDGPKLPGVGVQLEASRLGVAGLDKLGLGVFAKQVRDGVAANDG